MRRGLLEGASHLRFGFADFFKNFKIKLLVELANAILGFLQPKGRLTAGSPVISAAKLPRCMQRHAQRRNEIFLLLFG